MTNHKLANHFPLNLIHFDETQCSVTLLMLNQWKMCWLYSPLPVVSSPLRTVAYEGGPFIPSVPVAAGDVMIRDREIIQHKINVKRIIQ